MRADCGSLKADRSPLHRHSVQFLLDGVAGLFVRTAAEQPLADLDIRPLFTAFEAESRFEVDLAVQSFVFDVLGQTLARTTLGALRAVSRGNADSAVGAGRPMDGHFVQGHVDGTAEVESVEVGGGQWRVWFGSCSPVEAIEPYLAQRGSIALDGGSRTLAEVAGGRFMVALIPTTLGVTTVADWSVGSRVNVETDLLVRAVVHRLGVLAGGGVTMEGLRRAGFA